MKARFTPLWCVAVIATAAAFVVHLAIRFETVRLGYEVSAAREDQRKLVHDKRLLSVESATLSQAGRIEAVARRSLQMDSPGASQVVHIKERRPEAAVSGRVW